MPLLDRLNPPSQLEEYRILRSLGHGAMGRVYLAHDTLLDRPVAIKFLALLDQSGSADERAGLRERFYVEARAIARLSHPNVVTVYRIGEWRGRPYLVSELLRGESLDRLPRPQPWQRVLEIGIGLCRGLAAAHRRSVLHRDIKPANAMLTRGGEVKLLDFGLAKLLEPSGAPASGSLADLSGVMALPLSREGLVPSKADEAAARPSEPEGGLQATRAAVRGRPPSVPEAPAPPTSGEQHEIELSATAPQLRLPRGEPPAAPSSPPLAETRPGSAGMAAPEPPESSPSLGLTRAGDVLGSPLYMAPELWRGDPPTPRSDLYSLGTLLYELCAGRAPHEGSTLEELPQRVQTLDAAPLGSVAPAVEPRLGAIIDRCLRREPELRFESADALLAALEGLADLFERAERAERAPSRDELAATDNPYRGLQSFEARHRALFFGRDTEARAILDRLRAEPMVVVTGDSGVGKSSLCQAGVLAAVQAGALGPGLVVVRVPPGRRRLWVLASALAGPLGRDENELHAVLRTAPQELGRDLRQKNRRADAPRRLLLFVDQLEDLFSQQEPEAVDAFGHALRELCEYAPDVQLLGCVRSDFLSRLAALPGLGPELGRALFLLGPLTPEGLRESIVRPALLRGFRFSSNELVDSLVAATGVAIGGLPLLQFTLSLLWEARDVEQRLVPQRALDQLGGLGGALARYADGVLKRLLPAQHRAARFLLGQLVTIEGTRAQRTRAELLDPFAATAAADGGAELVAAREALEALVRGRLVTVHAAADAEPEAEPEAGAARPQGPGDDRGSLYELAHDALLTRWDTLRGWLAHDAERRAARQRVSRAAAEWERLGRAPELLFQPLQLREVEGLLSDEQQRDLLARDVAFLRASRRAVRWQRVRRILVLSSAPLVLALLWVGAQLRASHTIRQQALQHVATARAELTDGRRQNQQAEALRQEVFGLFDQRRQAEAEKQWDRLQALESELRAGYRRASKAAEAAFMLRSDDPLVRDTLATVLSERAQVAERGRFLSSRDELLARVWLFDHDGRYRRRWLAPARLELASRPGPAAVSVTPIDEHHQLRGEAQRELGVTPLVGAELAPGAYLLTLRPQQPERLPVSYPLLVERGEELRLSVYLPRAAAVPVGFAYVPAGRSIFGSDADDSQRRDFFYNVPAHPVHTAAFLIARHETTYAEWLAFLRSLPPEELERRRPRAGQAGASGSLELRPVTGPVGERLFELTLQPTKTAYRARENEPLTFAASAKRPPAMRSIDWLKLPVTGISSEDAQAYLRWLDQTGRVPGARLCTEVEWERAARGADERHYPHGDQLLPSDAAFDQTYGQDPGAMGPDPVGSHPASRSLFGVDDLTGNAFEWTENSVSDKPFALRGGAYFYGGRTCRLDNRHESVPTLRDATVGLRVCATMRED